MPAIALVDDDRHTLVSLSTALRSAGYCTRTYGDGPSALQALLECPPDVAILDINMPGMNGMELLRRLRETSETPVIFLTARTAEQDEFSSFKLGADDFIGKPYSIRVVIERIEAVLRRAARHDLNAGTAPRGPAIRRGKLVMDPERHECTWDGRQVGLTVKEFALVWTLAREPGVVKTRNALLDAAYGESDEVGDRTIDGHIKQIREKFGAVDAVFGAIQTIRRLGYRFGAD